jgi:hypothetical protein
MMVTPLMFAAFVGVIELLVAPFIFITAINYLSSVGGADFAIPHHWVSYLSVTALRFWVVWAPGAEETD